MSHKKPLYIPRGSRHIADHEWTEYKRRIPATWHAAARRKGYRIDRRLLDRLYVALECLTCGAHTAHRVYTLMAVQPACGGCQQAARQGDALKVGFTLKTRDEAHRH